MAQVQLELPLAQIEAICKKWQIAEFALFGSVLRSDFRPDSDIDVLITFQPTSQWSLLDFSALIAELEAIFGRKVDVLDRPTVEKSHNYIRRQAILSEAQVIHRAA